MAKKAIRPIRIEGNIAYVPLTKGYEAIIDADVAGVIGAWNWYAKVTPHTVYAVRDEWLPAKRRVSMHSTIIGAVENKMIDHVNRNGLDNRRSNLRHASPSENQFNKGVAPDNMTGLKGVSLGKDGYWRARIKFAGKEHHLGSFRDMGAASEAYRRIAKILHGDFAAF